MIYNMNNHVNRAIIHKSFHLCHAKQHEMMKYEPKIAAYRFNDMRGGMTIRSC